MLIRLRGLWIRLLIRNHVVAVPPSAGFACVFRQPEFTQSRLSDNTSSLMKKNNADILKLLDAPCYSKTVKGIDASDPVPFDWMQAEVGRHLVLINHIAYFFRSLLNLTELISLVDFKDIPSICG